MECVRMNGSMSRGILFAAVLTFVIGSNLGLARRSDNWAIDQAQFSYDAVVNTRTSAVSDVHYDLHGDWSTSVSNRLTGTVEDICCTNSSRCIAT